MARILFVSEKYAPDLGGVAQSGTRISRAMAQQGHDVHVFTFSRELESGEVESESAGENLTIHRFGSSRKIDFTQQQALIFLEWLHSEYPIDLVWSHYAWNTGFMGIWFAKQFQIRSIVAVRGNDVDRQLFPPGDLSRLLWMLNNATQIVSVSADLAKKVESLTGRPAIVLHNSVDSQLFCPGNADPFLMKKYNIEKHEMVMVFSGELRAKKGLPMLVECFHHMSQLRPTRLLIIGEIRRQDRGVFERAMADLSDQISGSQPIVTGHLSDQQDVAAHLRLGDIFLLPSLWDGLPNSLLESMAIGLPVIASDAGAIGEVLTHNESGLVVPRSHLHQFAQRIDQFFSRPANERERITTAAQKIARVDHSLAKEKERLSKILETVFVETPSSKT